MAKATDDAKPKLTTGQVHDLFVAFSLLDREEDLKLTPDVRLKIAININLVKPHAEAYERVRTRALADVNRDNRARDPKERLSEPELQSDYAEKDAALRAAPAEVAGLKTLLKPDLRLDDNPKIGGMILARLWPILDGIEA